MSHAPTPAGGALLPPAPAAPATRPRVAVVVGSGGVKCAAAMGLWKVLAREGVPVDLVVGCSGGAIYTAAMALGLDVAESERRTLVMWRDLFRRFHYRSVLRMLFPGLLGFREDIGLLDDRKVGGVLRTLYGERTFADCRIPLHVAATDWGTGAKVAVAAGSVADAVRASIALPLLLRPVSIDGRLLVDGGLSDPLPVDVAIREGADLILAMGFDNVVPAVGSFTTAMGRISTIVTNHLLQATFAFHTIAHHAEVIPILPRLDRRIGIGDADAVPALIDEGARATEAQLPYLLRLLAAGRPPAPAGVP